MSTLAACLGSALQVLLDHLLRPEDLCQEQMAEAALQAYLLAPCSENRAAALTLLACMQPSCKLLKKFEVNATQPHDPRGTHASAKPCLLGLIAGMDDVASTWKTPALARPWCLLQEHLQAARLAKDLDEKARGQLGSFVQNAKQKGAHLASMPSMMLYIANESSIEQGTS